MKWAAGAFIFLFAWTLTTHGKYSASGDEPHFLMIDESLAADRDLDLANNYAQDDGRLFGHDHLDAGLHAVPARDGRLLPAHDIGLPVALLPVYVTARALSRMPPESALARFRMDRGLFTYSLIGLFLIALTASGLLLLFDGLASVASERTAALLIVAAGISPPIVSHSFLVFPEALALFATCVVLWLAFDRETPFSPWSMAAAALMLGVLPWAHHKYLPYVFGLALVLAWKRWRDIARFSRRDLAVALALFAAPQIALQIWTWREWGTLVGTLTTNDVPFSMGVFRVGSIGLLMDRQSGLLGFAPLYWIVPACWWVSGRRTWPLLIPTVLLYVPAAAFTHGWWAGFSPAARYITPLMPIFVVVIAEAWQYAAIRCVFGVLLLVQLLIDAVIWQHPRSLWPATGGNAALEALGSIGRLYEHALPAAQVGAPIAPAALALAAASAIVVLFAYLAPAAAVRPGA